jgi:PAT family beta-lactamase induction signal transducer AmpG
MKTNNPWWWIPTLYFAEGIPYFLVNNISVVMFNNMGMSKGDMALYTSLLYLPWVIKPLWSPFVDLIRTKRWWVVTMQILMSVAFALLAFTLPHPSPEVIASGQTPVSLFSLTLVIFWITAFASATHDIAADGFYMLALKPGEQSLFVGIRSTFYRLSSIFGQGVLVVIAGLLETRLGDIPKAWSLTLLFSAVLFSGITIWHLFRLPKPSADVSSRNQSEGAVHGSHPDRVTSAMQIAGDFVRTFVTFFQKKHIWIAMAFMLLYRLPEAFLVKMMNPFLLDGYQEGGLGLTTEAVGLVYGTVGVAALTVGGILGGIAASRWGLKKSLWPMALSLTLPCLSFVFLAAFQPTNIWVIGSCVTLDQFGYGFGFTAYMLYLIYFADGEFKTAHYSLCTAFMALSMMIPGMVAGYIQEALGYTQFFGFVMLCCLVTVAVTLMLKVDPEYGKKN